MKQTENGCQGNFYVYKARILAESISHPPSETRLRQMCKPVLQHHPKDLTQLKEAVNYIEQIRPEHHIYAFVLSYIVFLASSQCDDGLTTAQSAYLLGRTSIKLNLDLHNYAIPSLTKALELFKSLNQPVYVQARIVEQLAKANRNLGRFKEALEYYQTAIEMSRSANLLHMHALLEYALGKMYANYLKQPLRGLTHINRATHISGDDKSTDPVIRRYKAIFLDETGN